MASVMPRMSDDIEKIEGTSSFRFKDKCKATKETQTRVLVLKEGCKRECGQKHAFKTPTCKAWGWKVHETLERVVENIQIDTAKDIILGNKCSWEVLLPIETYLQGWGVSRNWKLLGIFDRKNDIGAVGFKSTEELIFAMLERRIICDSSSECDHRTLVVSAGLKQVMQEPPTPVNMAPTPTADLLPGYSHARQDSGTQEATSEKSGWMS